MIAKGNRILYGEHQLLRMSQRGISKSIVNSVLQNGIWQKTNKHLCYEVEYKGVVLIVYKGRFEVEIITCKLNRELTIKAEESEHLGFNNAVKDIVKKISF